MDPVTTSALISASSQTGGGLLGLANQALQNKYNKQAERRQNFYLQQQEARQFMYNKMAVADERAYNDPSAQMSRLLAAGINPNLAAQYITNQTSALAAPTASANTALPKTAALGDILAGVAAGRDIVNSREARLNNAVQRQNQRVQGEILQINKALQSNALDKATYDLLMQKQNDAILVLDAFGNYVPLAQANATRGAQQTYNSELRSTTQLGLQIDANNRANEAHVRQQEEAHARFVDWLDNKDIDRAQQRSKIYAEINKLQADTDRAIAEAYLSSLNAEQIKSEEMLIDNAVSVLPKPVQSTVKTILKLLKRKFF